MLGVNVGLDERIIIILNTQTSISDQCSWLA